MPVKDFFIPKIGKIFNIIMQRSSQTRRIIISNLLINYSSEVISELLATKRSEVISELLATKRSEVISELLRQNRMDVLSFLYSHYYYDTLIGLNKISDGSIKYVPNEVIKIIIGAADTIHEGWLSTDIEFLNITSKKAWSSLFRENSIDVILAEHVFEHLTIEEIQVTLSHIHGFLKAGGTLRLAVPDAFHPSRYYYNLVKPGGSETFIEHKSFLDYKILLNLAKEYNFSINLLEYFDEKGYFHKKEYADELGIIKRNSSSNVGIDLLDPKIVCEFYESIPEHLRGQFFELNMTYTSLIADLKKID